MQVHHRLAGGRADVHADVVAVRVEPAVEEVFRPPDEGEEGGLLLVCGVEEARDVAVGDEEEVAGIPCQPDIAHPASTEKLHELLPHVPLLPEHHLRG